MPENTTHKFAVILSKKIEPGRALNAASHMIAALVANASPDMRNQMLFLNYEDANGGLHPTSGLSLVVLKADNSNKIRTARAAVIEAHLPFTDFLESMTQDSYVEQMARTKTLTEEALEYWGLAVFGPKEAIDPITRKFSLWI